MFLECSRCLQERDWIVASSSRARIVSVKKNSRPARARFILSRARLELF